MKTKSIFPFIEVIFIGNSYRISDIRFETYVRKKHRGKYYLWEIYRIFHYPENISDGLNQIFKDQNIFMKDVYRTILLGKVNLKLVHEINGVFVPLFELDPDQTPEEERLITIK
jgi:hypothetical protein